MASGSSKWLIPLAQKLDAPFHSWMESPWPVVIFLVTAALFYLSFRFPELFSFRMKKKPEDLNPGFIDAETDEILRLMRKKEPQAAVVDRIVAYSLRSDRFRTVLRKKIDWALRTQSLSMETFEAFDEELLQREPLPQKEDNSRYILLFLTFPAFGLAQVTLYLMAAFYFNTFLVYRSFTFSEFDIVRLISLFCMSFFQVIMLFLFTEHPKKKQEKWFAWKANGVVFSIAALIFITGVICR